MEREGRRVDHDAAAGAMADYVTTGFDTFDMADHYGSGELIAGRCARQLAPGKIRLFTKWRPESGPMTPRGPLLQRVCPANTLIEISALVGDYEIEAEAVVGAAPTV